MRKDFVNLDDVGAHPRSGTLVAFGEISDSLRRRLEDEGHRIDDHQVSDFDTSVDSACVEPLIALSQSVGSADGVLMAPTTFLRLIDRWTDRLTFSRVARSAAHDINNLLTIVLGWIARLNLRNEDDRHATRNIELSVARVSLLTAQVLGYERIGNGTPRVDLNAIVIESRELLDSRFGNRIVVVESELTTALVDLDANEASQIVLNLVLNAIDATMERGTIAIRIRSSADGQRIQLVVEDDGIGMDSETQRVARERRFTTKSGEHSGLGLSTVHHIATSIGGELAISSTKECGTVVEVTLPCSAGAGDPT